MGEDERREEVADAGEVAGEARYVAGVDDGRAGAPRAVGRGGRDGEQEVCVGVRRGGRAGRREGTHVAQTPQASTLTTISPARGYFQGTSIFWSFPPLSVIA